jgi:hypothetical protein
MKKVGTISLVCARNRNKASGKPTAFVSPFTHLTIPLYWTSWRGGLQVFQKKLEKEGNCVV